LTKKRPHRTPTEFLKSPTRDFSTILQNGYKAPETDESFQDLLKRLDEAEGEQSKK
jgi:hypothetical protein